MFYEIIKDEKELDNFIKFLPSLSDDEVYYVTLFARKKYAPDSNIRADKAQLKTLVSTKENLKKKIRQLEVKIGEYTIYETPVPPESLAIYISTTPRSIKKTTQALISNLLQNSFDNSYENPKKALYTAFQTNKSTTKFITCDVDKEENFLPIMELLGLDSYYIKTRGGYHILAEPNKIQREYTKVRALCDQIGDILSPIPGCTQGGHTVTLHKF